MFIVFHLIDRCLPTSNPTFAKRKPLIHRHVRHIGGPPGIAMNPRMNPPRGPGMGGPMGPGGYGGPGGMRVPAPNSNLGPGGGGGGGGMPPGMGGMAGGPRQWQPNASTPMSYAGSSPGNYGGPPGGGGGGPPGPGTPIMPSPQGETHETGVGTAILLDGMIMFVFVAYFTQIRPIPAAKTCTRWWNLCRVQIWAVWVYYLK